MPIKSYILTSSLLFSTTLFIAQTNKIDSLYTILSSSKIKDTTKINTWNALSAEFTDSKADTAIYFAKKALELSVKNNYKYGEIEANSNIGGAFYNLGKTSDAITLLLQDKEQCLKLTPKDASVDKKQKLLGGILVKIGNSYTALGQPDSALSYFKQYLKLSEIMQYQRGIAVSYLSIGVINIGKGNTQEALKNMLASLKISEKMNFSSLQAYTYNNISAIYMFQKDLTLALKNLQNCIRVAEIAKLPSLKASAYSNMGIIYIEQKKYNEALISEQKSYLLSKELQNEYLETTALAKMCDIYTYQGYIDSAIVKGLAAVTLAKNKQNYSSSVQANKSLANTYNYFGKYNLAIPYGEEALSIAQKANDITLINSCAQILTESYFKTQQYKKAYEMKSLFVTTNDSILSNSNQKELLNQELKYNYQKQAFTDSLNYVTKKQIHDIETQNTLKAEKNKRSVLYVGLALIILFAGFMVHRFKVSQSQKNLIQIQSQRLELTHQQLSKTHHLLETKSKEIQDSILYAKEIQNTFLKPLHLSTYYLNDALLVYKPKDVVSGDFYWYKQINDAFFVVVGDCTGHGVPGAIISVLAIQSLEKSINQINDYSQLHQLVQLMNSEFSHYDNKLNRVSIGLDFSVICIEHKKNTVHLSGSGSTILLKDTNNQLLSESFDSYNIGGLKPAIYNPSTKSYDLKSIQSVFLYTDGIIDQKGFATGKRFTSKKLKELISNLNTTNATEAYKKIENEITHWQGESEQIDDMTLLGIQFNIG